MLKEDRPKFHRIHISMKWKKSKLALQNTKKRMIKNVE